MSHDHSTKKLKKIAIFSGSPERLTQEDKDAISCLLDNMTENAERLKNYGGYFSNKDLHEHFTNPLNKIISTLRQTSVLVGHFCEENHPHRWIYRDNTFLNHKEEFHNAFPDFYIGRTAFATKQVGDWITHLARRKITAEILQADPRIKTVTQFSNLCFTKIAQNVNTLNHRFSEVYYLSPTKSSHIAIPAPPNPPLSQDDCIKEMGGSIFNEEKYLKLFPPRSSTLFNSKSEPDIFH